MLTYFQAMPSIQPVPWAGAVNAHAFAVPVNFCSSGNVCVCIFIFLTPKARLTWLIAKQRSVKINTLSTLELQRLPDLHSIIIITPLPFYTAC